MSASIVGMGKRLALSALLAPLLGVSTDGTGGLIKPSFAAFFVVSLDKFEINTPLTPFSNTIYCFDRLGRIEHIVCQIG